MSSLDRGTAGSGKDFLSRGRPDRLFHDGPRLSPSTDSSQDGAVMANTLPYMQFYPADWLTDPALRSCSLEARGAWIDIICLMWKCPDRGVLRTNGHPWSDQQIAQALGIPLKAAKAVVSELIDAGVTAKDADGSLSCRRIVREEEERKGDRERQQRHRESDRNGSVTQMSHDCPQEKSEVRSQKSEVINNYPVNRSTIKEKSRPVDPEVVFEDARRDFRRYARDAGWEATDFGDLTAENRVLWARAVKEHGSDLVLAAVKTWTEEQRDMPKKFNPVGKFIKRIKEYIEAAAETGSDEGDGYPDLSKVPD